VEVAVNAPTPHHKSFSYSIPEGMVLSPGQAVWVPFGSRHLQGIVLEVTDHPQVSETRDVVSVISHQPILTPAQLELARWMSEYYRAPLFDCASTMMPPAWQQRAGTFIRLADGLAGTSANELDPLLHKVVTSIAEEGEISFEELKGKLSAKEITAVNSLVSKGILQKYVVISPPRVSPKLQRVLYLEEGNGDKKPPRGPKQRAVIELLATEGPQSMQALKDSLGVSWSNVSPLVSAGLVQMKEERIMRDPLADSPLLGSLRPQLTPDQNRVWARIRDAINQATRHAGSPKSSDTLSHSSRDLTTRKFLLHGVTGSGKTEVYIRALEETVAAGGRGILMVPEIALTPQMVDRFRSRFGDKVAVLHSGLSLGEQYDEWWRIKAGEFDVVIGSRSAIFAPQPDLRLIIIDEEHEATYKQSDSQPRYHTRDVAIKLSESLGAVLVMGSATPEICTYYDALNGRHELLKMPDRIPFGAPPEDRMAAPGDSRPRTAVVDLRTELREGNRSIFSRTLVYNLRETLAMGQQAILFLNRRGTSTFVQCRECGYVARCRHCDIPLTYHAAVQNLLCHQCSYRVRPPQSCPTCGSHGIRFLGAGTQRVVEEVEAIFPQARVIRWDADVTRNFKDHEELLRKFSQHEADVLVGTQMIAKGLDIPLVTLVGVINADINLHLPDFHSSERTFQLLTQVAGRAGRGPYGGLVVIQTYNPEHYAIRSAAKQDYDSFYEQESVFRRNHGYPPFSRLIRLGYSHYSLQRAEEEAGRLHALLEKERRYLGLSGVRIMGPAPPFFRKARGRYRWQILLFGEESRSLLDQVNIPQGWIVDVDPLSML